MRLTALAFILLPVAAQAQETILPTPNAPVAQAQSCPVGMQWDAGAGACAMAPGDATPIQSLPGGVGCSGHWAAREVTS